ncbi:MAG: helix-turn-helix domain-containing protein [Ruminococcaceae bacterium]|nr:helix-turn-helix domain-containing protein [Oscillospiraceae bacterium]
MLCVTMNLKETPQLIILFKGDRNMNEVNIGQRIKRKREQQNLSLQFVADKLDVNRSSVMRWENGETSRIKLPMLERLAQILQTTPEYLMGYEEDDIISITCRNALPESVCMIPVLDTVLTNDYNSGSQHIVGYEVADSTFRHNCFFLRINGNAMAPRLEEGDYVLVHRQDTLNNGETGVCLIDNQKQLIATLYQDKNLELRSYNPYYPTMTFDDTEKSRIKIIGKVIESRRKW